MRGRPSQYPQDIHPEVKLWISGHGEEGVFGGGKWHLLKAVEEEGSIQRAAKKLGRSYRKAWGDIKRAEEGLGHPLVKKIRGGSTGGTTTLTDFGHQLLRTWDTYHGQVEKDMNRHYQRILTPLIGSGD